MLPHLTTSLTGPPLDLEKHIFGSRPAIGIWLHLIWSEHAAFFHPSVDVRNAGGEPQ
jgi:hypothetical protein